MSVKFWKGHPPGVTICFFTELWERFSYYGMRALLIFYLTQHFLYSDEKAYLIYGAYTAMVYMLPVLGGVIADRYLGYRKAVTLGAVLLVLGHFGMVFEGPKALAITTADGLQIDRHPLYQDVFFLSLALIATGVGFLKTNVSAMVGALYEKGDPRRDSGFTYFYMGINIGGAAAPLLCGWLGQTYGWGYGFGLAGIGMLAGLIMFLWGQKYLEGKAEPPEPEVLKRKVALGVSFETFLYGSVVLIVCFAWLMLKNQQAVGAAISVFGAAVGIFLLTYSLRRCSRQDRDKLVVSVILIGFIIVFFSFYEQMGSSLNLFADRVVDRRVFGYEVPASTLQSLPAIFVILIAPALSILWIWLGKHGWEPTTPVKFSMGIAFLSLAFFLLVAGSTYADGAKVALIWFVLNFFFLVVGELCIFPVGLSMITRLSPREIVGTMMGVFMLALSASSFIAGKIAQATSGVSDMGTDAALGETTAQFIDVYTQLGLMAIGVAVFLYIISPILNRWMHEEGTGNPTLIVKLYPSGFARRSGVSEASI